METTIITILVMILVLELDQRLIVENLALRQQLAVMKQSIKRPKIRKRDRAFWVILSQFWKSWRDALIIVKPETVIRWHRKGFKLFWTLKSRKKTAGRPPIDTETKKLIEDMAKANPLWGAPRIHGELLKLGVGVSERTVSNIIKSYRPAKPPSQTWRTFLRNHMHNSFAIDFFTVPTATFNIIYVFVVLWHKNRKVVHFNLTMHPTATWTAQQVVEACPWDTAPKYLLRDRDAIYGHVFRNRVKNMGINDVISAPRSPWQNPYVERIVGSIRRDCINHVIVLNEEHLKRILTEYFEYYHHDRTHISLSKDTPLDRPTQNKPEDGKIIAFPRLGGLHHRYQWRKAA
jgi:transposase InsO family protein